MAPPTARAPKFAAPVNPVLPKPDVSTAVATGVKNLANAGDIVAAFLSGIAKAPPTGAVTSISAPSSPAPVASGKSRLNGATVACS